jgi:hypothetical protein
LVVTGELASGGADCPSDLHVKVAERAQHYLFNSRQLGLSFGVSPIKMRAFVDASYVTDGHAKSRLGGCVFMNDDSGAVYSFSTNDAYPESTISHSSCAAEIKALDKIVQEIEYQVQVCECLQLPITLPVPIFIDNKSAVDLCSSLKTTSKTKTINMRINYIREMLNKGLISLHFVPSEHNVADILTKPLIAELFEQHQIVLLQGLVKGGLLDIINDLVLAYCVFYIDEDTDA